MYIENTPENQPLIIAIIGATRKDHKTTLLDDGYARRINGRYIVGNVPVLDSDGKIRLTDDYLVTRRQRFKIPKGHPWRGERP